MTDKEYDVYFDESGDLGWSLDKPYRKGGSSQFFTIAYMILPTSKNKYITRFLRKFHKNRNGKEKEIKGASFRNPRAKTIARTIISLLELNPDIIMGAVTIKKANAPTPVLNTNNDDVLYNHMVQTGICSKLAKFDKVNIIPDKRSVPSGSQNSCSDLLKGKLWFELDSLVEVSYIPQESFNNSRLIFIDWIANFVWRNYENNSSEAYELLQPYIEEEILFL